MTREEILQLSETEFGAYIRTEGNKALDKTLLNKKNQLEQQKEDLRSQIQTLKAEANAAFEELDTQTANEKGIQMDLLEREIETVDETIERFIANHETLIIRDHERLSELKGLVQDYYRPKVIASKRAFDEQVNTLLPLMESGERLVKRQADLMQTVTRFGGSQYNHVGGKFLSVEHRDSLSRLLGGTSWKITSV